VWPWRYFAKANMVLDVGTGAGFPGIPLAIVLPETKFVLSDSTQKRARFVEMTVESLDLPNVTVSTERGENLFKAQNFNIATARAVAPLSRIVPLLAPGLRGDKSALLYKGPDAETEIAEARGETQKRHLSAKLVDRYRLPEEFGERTLVRIAKQSQGA
jgi:16S rRNA (guanine527-N7)-methyltransferase